MKKVERFDSGILSRVFLIFSLVLFLNACSSGPKQYAQDAPPQPDFSQPLSLEDLQVPRPVSQEAGDMDEATRRLIEERVRHNSRQPIIYNEGAGGITFENTFKEVQDILYTDRIIWGGDGYITKSGVLIAWNSTKDQMVFLSLINLAGWAYEGSMDAGSEVGQLELQQNIEAEFNAGGETKEEKWGGFINKLYNGLLKPENPDALHCFERKPSCSIRENARSYILDLPNMMFFTTKATPIVVMEIRLFNPAISPMFESTLDIYTGKFVSQNGTFGLNDNWETSLPFIGEKFPTPDKAITELVLSFLPLSIGFERSNFERNHRSIDNDAKLLSVQTGVLYKYSFVIQDKLIQYAKDENGYTYSLAPVQDEGVQTPGLLPEAAPDKNYLSMKSVIPAADLTAFATGMETFLTTNLYNPLAADLNADIRLNRKLGFNSLTQDARERKVSQVNIMYDSSDKTGRYYELVYERENLSVFRIEQITHPLMAGILTAINTGTVPASKTVAGFQLPLITPNADPVIQRVGLSAIDVIAGEATAQPDLASAESAIRSQYVYPQSLLTYAWSDTERRAVRNWIENVERVRLGTNISVTLYLKPDANLVTTEQKTSPHESTLIGVEINHGQVTVCGNVVLNMGDPVVSSDPLLSILDKIRAKGADVCPFIPLDGSADGMNMITSIFLPKERVQLFITENELSGIRMYTTDIR